MSKLNEYIRHFENTIQSSPLIGTYELHIDRKTEDIVYINGKIGFSDGSTLDFKEFVTAVGNEIDKYKYAYNYRKHDNLIFRYDNAPDPRARNLPSFPHHVHLPPDSIAESLSKNINDILNDIEDRMIRAV